jgi:hypothetical protein
MFRDAGAEHRVKARINLAYLWVSNVCLSANCVPSQAPHFLTLAFLTIPPFSRHAGVGAIDLA